MRFDVVTIFPEFFRGILEYGLLKRALAAGQVAIRLHDLRDFTDDRHRTVDDRPFGGGPGMVFKPEPLFRAVDAIRGEAGETSLSIILMSPQGRLLTQSVAEEISRRQRVVLICGRYEGVDERVVEHLASDEISIGDFVLSGGELPLSTKSPIEISIGDFVLSGGELPAALIMEAATRLIPGVLGNEESCAQDSFSVPEGSAAADGSGLLDCPHYTRPAEFRGWKVPEVLLSGNHEQVRQWRRRQALEKTARRRPDLIAQAALSKEDRVWLESMKI